MLLHLTHLSILNIISPVDNKLSYHIVDGGWGETDFNQLLYREISVYSLSCFVCYPRFVITGHEMKQDRNQSSVTSSEVWSFM